MKEVSITVLRCPECGVELLGLDRDVIFFCRSCCSGYIARSSSDFERVPVFAQPSGVDIDPKTLLRLPMWAFKIDTSVIAAENEIERIERVIKKIDWVWITAFRAWRSSYFGDPGLLYTQKTIVPKMTPAESDQMPVGCSILAADAAEYLTPLLLHIVDRVFDVARVDIEVKIIAKHLVSVPFVDVKDQILDTQMDWKWPAVFIEDIVQIKEMFIK